MRKTKILITGGCGFIGHHFVEHVIKNTDWDVVVLDKLNYASSGFDRLRDVKCYDDSRILIIPADFTLPISEGVRNEIGKVDYLVHMGAETHVDKSIENPEPFVMSNVVGTMRVLDFARTLPDLKCLVYFSTDEVFGPAPEGTFFKENDAYNCTNPYSASKAGGEQLANAYANTYKLPIIVTHTMNVFGERQHPEKFIPSTIRKVLKGEKVVIHANPAKTKAGSRFYVHARNVADAMMFLLFRGKIRDAYNLVGEREVDNLELAKMIAHVVGKPLDYEMVDFHSSRPGHDLRYALDGEKMQRLGWRYKLDLFDSLRNTVIWTLQNPRWLEI